MRRDIELKKIRIRFVQKAVNNPKEAEKELIQIAKGLGNTKNMSDTVYALTQIFGVSQKTIMRDLLNDIDV